MRILHVFRNPVGGLFRHVRDLARGQSEIGHEIGILCDSMGGGEFANRLLAETRPHCKLGIARTDIPRAPGLGDVAGIKAAMAMARDTGADVLHGHGAKGGLYARVAGWRLGLASTYTPHFGSLHYNWNSPTGAVYLSTEKLMRRLGSGICFVCDFEKKTFDSKVGIAGKPNVTIYNGLWPEEFKAAVAKADATDFMSLGEIRPVKGLDIMLRALARIDGATLTIVGDGPSVGELKALTRELGLSERVRFVGSKTVAEAVTMGKIMVLPSHSESFPYVVIETAASGLPLVATAVGGIPEIAPKEFLCPPGNVDALHEKMLAAYIGNSNHSGQTKMFLEDVKAKCDARLMCKSLVSFYETLMD